MNKITLALLLLPLYVCSQESDQTFTKELNSIAFGSCSHQDKTDHQLWDEVHQTSSDLWIWMGDNIYGDTTSMKVMREKYDLQKSHPGYQKLMKETQILGIWDDHDYGVNDGGKEYPAKDGSKVELFRFLEVADDHPARNRQGAYQSYTFAGTKNIKIILLDTRYFRDPLKKDEKNWNTPDPNGEILGSEQWSWFERQLQDQSADLILVISSIQVIPVEQRFEKWANFTAERNRLLELIETVGTPLVLLSGDRHISEVSRLDLTGSNYPLYEFTSSSLTNPWGEPRNEPNQYREKTIVFDPNFATMNFDVTPDQLKLDVQYIGQDHKKLQSHTVTFSR